MVKPRMDSDVVPVSIRLPKELYESIQASANRNRRSVNQEAIARLEVLQRLQEAVWESGAPLTAEGLRLRLAPFASAQPESH